MTFTDLSLANMGIFCFFYKYICYTTSTVKIAIFTILGHYHICSDMKQELRVDPYEKGGKNRRVGSSESPPTY